MNSRRGRNLAILALTLAGVVFARNLAHVQSEPAAEGLNPATVTRVMVDHVRVVAEKPFEQVRDSLEKQMGQFDPEAYKALASGDDAETVRRKIEAMAGPSGFMLFRASDHGALLRLAGQKKKAIQYLLGNPLIAVEMTRHDIRAGLYAPLRLLVYEDDEGKTRVEYDKPSSLFGQFGNAKVTEVAVSLDRKLEQLVAKAIR